MTSLKREEENPNAGSKEDEFQKNTIVEEARDSGIVEDDFQELSITSGIEEKSVTKAQRASLATVTYDLHDDLSTICLLRQYEVFKTPTMSEGSDILTVANSSDIDYKIATLVGSNTEDDFWMSVIEQYSDVVKNKKTALLEARLVEGIPEQMRSSIYLKVTRTRYKFHKESFESLLRQADFESSIHIPLSNNKKNPQYDSICKVFNYYTTKVTPKISKSSDRESSASISEYSLPPNNFVLHIGQVLSTISNLENDQVFFLMLKFKKMFDVLIKGEFFYKINRAIEDMLPELFAHIGKQGIQLSDFYKKTLFSFFSDKIEEQKLLQVVDFVLFEGFDFILRLIVYHFKEQSEILLKMVGADIASYLDSNDFFDDNFSFESVLEVKPDIVKYENEYHLVHANSFNKNDNELSNLVEINDELSSRISDLKHHLENLTITHEEIMGQTNEYNEKLSTVSKKKAELDSLNSRLQEKYEQLTMEQNLKNTIKANHEFSNRNTELEKQIDEVKKSIKTKADRVSVN